MRLQKFMAKSGVASRRKSEDLILQGRVTVNKEKVTKLGRKINPYKDIVHVDNKAIDFEEEKIYIILNKPVGYITTLDDEKNRKIVTDLITDIEERIYPIGRLDRDTSGLLLLTNDGDLTYKLTHPSNMIMKRYIATVSGIPNEKKLNQFRNGIKIDGSLTSPAQIEISKVYNNRSVLDISIYEGRNRQVRKMCNAIGHKVQLLERINIGELGLGNLSIGKWRNLTSEEVDYLKSL